MSDNTSDKSTKPDTAKPAAPSPWVERFLSGVKGGGDVLDVACGSGRHLRLALERGHRVTGIDRDVSRLDDIAARPDVSLIEADLETGMTFPLRNLRYDGVIVANYLWRGILADIVGCVADDGMLIYETFALGQEKRGKPANPDFLLRPNELIEATVPRLTVIAYEHGLAPTAHGEAIVQRIAACGPRHPFAAEAQFSLNGH